MAASPPALLLVHGEERFLVDQAADAWCGRARARSPELEIEVFDAPARLASLRRSLVEVPLLDPERSVLVRDPPQLIGSSRRGADSAEVLAAMLGERAPTTLLCIVAHTRVAPSNPVLAAVRALGGAISYHAQPRGREVRAWVEREVTSRGLRLGPGAVDQLLAVVGTDLGALASELDKLQAFAAGRPLTAADVTNLAAGDEPPEMWGVLEQLLGGTPGRGAATLDQLLAEGRPSQYLLSILAGQLRDLILAQAHVAVRGSAAGLASELRIPDWRADRLARQARAVAPAVAANWLTRLHDADRGVKAGEVGDQDALRLVVLGAARDAVRRDATRRDAAVRPHR